MGGVFFAFSVFVMRGLGDLPPAQGLAAMQSINRAAITPPFMIVLFATALASGALAAAGLRAWGEPYAGRLIAGGALYLAGVILPTIAFHVPRNDALERIAPDDAGGRGPLERVRVGLDRREPPARRGRTSPPPPLLADALRVG